MAYILKTLSPVHIHSGEVLKSINYMVKDGRVLIFDEMDVIKAVKENELLSDELLNHFAADNRRAEYIKTLDYFIEKGIIESSIVEKYKTAAINKVGDLSGQDIYRTMRNIFGTYIPGSTLKGVLRTAILYDFLLNKGIDYIKEAINFLNQRRRTPYTIDDYIIYGVEHNNSINRNIQNDPFKFLGIKDVTMQGKDIEIYEESIYNVKNFVPGNVIEAIPEGNYSDEFEFEIRLEERLINRYNEEIISYFNEEELVRVLYQFSKDIIEDEIKYYKALNSPLFNTREIIKKLEEIQSKNSLNSPVLRIGKGKGYKSNTVALAIKRLDRDYYLKEIRNIAKPFRYNRNYEYPKTRKFVGSPSSPKLLGFAILEKVDR
jgi:CRISPR-associated protein Csm5